MPSKYKNMRANHHVSLWGWLRLSWVVTIRIALENASIPMDRAEKKTLKQSAATGNGTQASRAKIKNANTKSL